MVSLCNQTVKRRRTQFGVIHKRPVYALVGCTCLLCGSWWGASAYQTINCASADVLVLSLSAFWKCDNYLYPIRITWSTHLLEVLIRKMPDMSRGALWATSIAVCFLVNTQVLICWLWTRDGIRKFRWLSLLNQTEIRSAYYKLSWVI